MLLKTHVWCDFKTNTRVVVVVVFVEIYGYAKLNAEMCDRLVVRDSAVVDIRWRSMAIADGNSPTPSFTPSYNNLSLFLFFLQFISLPYTFSISLSLSLSLSVSLSLSFFNSFNIFIFLYSSPIFSICYSFLSCFNYFLFFIKLVSGFFPLLHFIFWPSPLIH